MLKIAIAYIHIIQTDIKNSKNFILENFCISRKSSTLAWFLISQECIINNLFKCLSKTEL